MDVPGYFFSTGGTFGGVKILSGPTWSCTTTPLPEGTKPIPNHQKESGIRQERKRCLELLKAILEESLYSDSNDKEPFKWIAKAIAEIEKGE